MCGQQCVSPQVLTDRISHDTKIASVLKTLPHTVCTGTQEALDEGRTKRVQTRKMVSADPMSP